MTVETWGAIDGADGRYEVSDRGNLRSWTSGEPRPYGQYINSAGYMTATFKVYGKAKRQQVHQLVARAFLPPDPDRPCVNHKDRNRTNNNISNLEWCTYRENALHAKSLGVKFGRPHHEKPVLRSDGATFPSMSAAAREIGVPYSYIRDVCKGQQKSTRGYSFSVIGGDA